MNIKNYKYMIRNSSFVVLAMFLLSGCMSTKKVPYFQNKDEIDVALTKYLYDAKIMPKDILQIRVFSTTPDAEAQFNLFKSAETRNNASTADQGSVYAIPQRS